jgi:hypothetical protein
MLLFPGSKATAVALALAGWIPVATGADAQALGETMKLVPIHPLAKVLRSQALDATAAPKLELDGAKGETVSGQVVLVPAREADAVTASLSDLHHQAEPAAVISTKCARLQWVRYVQVSTNTADIPTDELVARAPLSLPDPFWEGLECSVEPRRLQPLWIDLDVPRDARPGVYEGELAVRGRSNRCVMRVSLRVRGFAMPEEPHQKVIQWWDFPGRTFEQLTPASAAYWQHLERSCAFVKRYRQTDVWAQWGLIQESKLTNGTGWDTSVFEKYADTAFKAGMRAVQLGSVGRHTKFQLDPESRTEPVDANLGRLAAVEQVVQKRGWKGRVLTGIADEPFIYHEATYQKVLERAQKVAPSVLTIEAVESDRIDGLDVYVPKLTHINLWWPQFQALQRQGKEVWFYTCCFPRGRYPNRFLDQPLVKARALHWISYLYRLDGYLHWGLNWFAADGDPYSEHSRVQWALPPGDGQVAYPGTEGWVGSLRLSAMRDGLQDFEYLWLLEQRLNEVKRRLGEEGGWVDPRQRSLELCRRVVQSFYEHTRDPKVLLDTRRAVADEIEALDTAPGLVVQTSPPEGSITPAGPITINIRGLAAPGTRLTLNGKALLPQNLSPKGCFAEVRVITAKEPEVVVTAELDGKQATVKRTFRVIE